MRAISLVATFVASVGLALLVDAWIIATLPAAIVKVLQDMASERR